MTKIELEVDFTNEKSKELYNQLMNTNEGADIIIRDCHLTAFNIDFSYRKGILKLNLIGHDFDWSKPNNKNERQ